MSEAILVKSNYTGAVIVKNYTILVDEWELDSQSPEGYPYKGTISIADITEEHIPEVILSLEDAVSGNFAPVCKSSDFYIYIWASSIPDHEITIPVVRASLV